MFNAVMLELVFPILMGWGPQASEFRIQLKKEVVKPSRLSSSISCCGMSVLNADLKSMNSPAILLAECAVTLAC